MSVVARARVVADDVLEGLRSETKRLPSRMLYDEVGTQLVEQITGVDDYYLTRNELRLLDAHLPAIAEDVGVAARVIEPGTGAGIRTKRLLAALDQPASYIQLDLAKEALALPPPQRPHGKTLVFLPGSTIDHFEPHDAVAFLGGLQRVAGPNARLLLGADGTHDREALLRAYDDEDGLTAELDKNALAHVNRTHNATFDPGTFEHRAVWNSEHSRVELHLVSLIGQEVTVGGERFTFKANEPMVTEVSYKHEVHAMRGILLAAGWATRQVFTAHEQPVRLWLCEPRGV